MPGCSKVTSGLHHSLRIDDTDYPCAICQVNLYFYLHGKKLINLKKKLFTDSEAPCDWMSDHLVVLRRHLATGLWGVAVAMFLLTLSVVALLICLCRLNIKYSRIARELAKVKTGSRLTSASAHIICLLSWLN